ncbi:unnamed protein product [Phyllotreta striolata]|uniref:Homologous recombination OB-fold protein OB-fold domain-containing protein n=1 Tax=Phyllotreta striolata TaxID=444603 RepID=A0A9N9XJ45_PHYSR|nr:unnamed protein product [Phyllotreta striolata]
MNKKIFDSDINFDCADFDLDDSFAPIFNSTQKQKSEKRREDAPPANLPKKIKLDNEVVTGIRVPETGNHTSPPSTNTVTGNFPGPAGFSSSSIVADEPWKIMEADFCTPNGQQLYEKYTIGWIKENYHCTDVDRMPFLAAVIEKIDNVTLGCRTQYVDVTLKDATGEIDAAIINSCYNTNSDYLRNGSVVVLKPIVSLTTVGRCCLNITSDTLLVIYHRKKFKESCEKDKVEKIVLHECCAENIRKEAADYEMNVLNSSKNKIQSKTTTKSLIEKNISSSSINRFNRSNSGLKNIINRNDSANKVNLSRINSLSNFPRTRCDNERNDKINVITSNCSDEKNEKNKDSEIIKDMLKEIDTDFLFDEF